MVPELTERLLNSILDGGREGGGILLSHLYYFLQVVKEKILEMMHREEPKQKCSYSKSSKGSGSGSPPP